MNDEFDAQENDSEQARDGSERLSDPQDATTDQEYAGIGPRAQDREYVDVPRDEKPHPSTIMQQEVLPSDRDDNE
jgi:hypothetical protein